MLFNSRGVCCVDFIGVVPTSVEVHDIVIRQVGHQLQKFRILTEEMLSSVGSAIELVVLQLAVTDFIHTFL